MTVELITGYAGTPHIGSADIGAFQAGIVGPGDYALATGNQLKATMSNANTIAVQSGDAVLNGRHVHLTGTTTATVQSGTQGQKRNDLAVLRYTKNTTTGRRKPAQSVVLQGHPHHRRPDGSSPHHRQYPRRRRHPRHAPLPHPIGRHHRRHPRPALQRAETNEGRVGFANPIVCIVYWPLRNEGKTHAHRSHRYSGRSTFAVI